MVSNEVKLPVVVAVVLGAPRGEIHAFFFWRAVEEFILLMIL